MVDNYYYAVIMAGGSGTRLWPLSRKEHPKQMLQLVEERTLFQSAVERLDGLFNPENIFIVTVREQADDLRKQCPQIPEGNFLIEPMPRGTASVIGLAGVALKNLNPGATMAVLTADHIIKNQDRFHKLLIAAWEAAQSGFLVTLGIKPTFPATGYGYIQQGESLGTFGDLFVYEVDRFVEKPSEEKAEQMLASGGYAWNSGMFVWRVDRVLEEFSVQMPDLFSKLQNISSVWNQPEKLEKISQVWPLIKPQTIDYGIMENAKKVAVIPAEELGWNDVGSWNALFEILPTDQDGNIVMGGEHIPLDTQDSLIYLDQTRRLIVTIGVRDLIVVDTGDVTLICKKDQAQKVRDVVDHLENESRDDYI